MKFDLVTDVNIKSYVETNKERLLLSLEMESNAMWITWILSFPVLITALSCPNGM
jgi:hypothetical protein